MLDSRDVAEKKFNSETHRLIGEDQLQRFGQFLDSYNSEIWSFRRKISNSCHIAYQPILLDGRATENISLLALVNSDNKLLSRILASLASVCEEISELVKEGKSYYDSFLYYGEDCSKSKNTTKSMGRILETLQKVQCFVDRSQQVILLLLRQLCAILGKEVYLVNNYCCFPEAIDCLAELLVCLLYFDSLLSLPLLKEHWSIYRRSVRSVLHNPKKYNFNHEELRSLDRQLISLEETLLSESVLKKTLEKCTEENLILTIKSSNMCNEIAAYINYLLLELERDDHPAIFTQIWLQTNVLVVLEHTLNGTTDKKLLKRLFDINRKVSACTLHGNIVWLPEQFLIKQVPSFAKHLDHKTVEANRLLIISTKSQNLPKDSQNLSAQACFLLIEVSRVAKKDMSKFDIPELQRMCNLLIEMLKLSKTISELVKWILNLHAEKGLPVTKTVLVSTCRLIEVLKCFQFTFIKNLVPLIYVTLMISQHLMHKSLTLLHGIRKSFTQEKSYKQQQLDVLSALNVCEQCLKGPNTTQRILVAKLALSASGLSNDVLHDLRAVINRLELISSLEPLLSKICDCSFLYWHLEYVLPVYFSKLIEGKADISRHYLFLTALSDCPLTPGDKLHHLARESLKSNLYNPINQIVETNLRLQTHLHLQLPPSDPFKDYFPLNFMKLLPAKMFNNYLSIRNETEHYLSTMFYNLTTVVLHDWRTYGEMRRLAYLQYGLETVEDNLPMQTLEQGLDVLEIMRNIHIFVGRYLYNLNNQVFVEESSNNKHLNTINISHVANSIRTHGIGIMNTTVNFTYQFLQNKFYTFSQFMFDEHIKSRLLKDIRFFSDNKTALNQMYPYERAEKFNFGIRKLGLNEDGLSYLDLFRKLITQIGNAMGYVRLIRSGGRRCLADGTCFIPDLKAVDDLSQLLEFDQLPDAAKEAANSLIKDIKILVDNFEEATEYFQLLVNVFSPVFRSSKHNHLRNFYIIVPPLTINFVEHSLTCKERLNKKNKNDASFTDDGFAMGLAYIIELLQQEDQLQSLHWFYSVKQKFVNDMKKNQEQKILASKDDEKLQQTLTLTEKRIYSFEREFDLLHYNFSSARIFFQS